MNKKRKYSVTSWLSEEELTHLKNNISKTCLTRSDYIRKCALGANIRSVSDIRDLMVDLREISNNLGQLTYNLNNGDVTVLGDNLKEIREDLRDIWSELLKVLKKK